MSLTVGQLIEQRVIEATNGFSSGDHNQDGIGVPHLRPFNVSPEGRVSLEQVKYIPPVAAAGHPEVRYGDIIFNNTNTEELVGKTAYWTRNETWGFSNHMTRLRVVRQEALSARFLAYALHHHWVIGESRKLCRRHVAQASILGERFREISIPSIPRVDQDKVATVLAKVQRAIEVEDKLIATVQELNQAVMRALFTRGLHREAQKETELGLAPEGWDISTVRSKARVIAGGTPSRGEARYWSAGTIPWVKTGEIDYRVITDTEEKITLAGLTASAAKLLPKESVLVAMYGQGVTRGRVALLGIEAATNQACVGLIPIDGELLPRFLYYYLAHSYERLRSLSHGAQQQNLNAELVGSFPLPLPKPAEQHEIASILGVIDEKISVHERKRAVLRDLFRTLLNDLMTSRIRVADLDIDVSEVTAA